MPTLTEKRQYVQELYNETAENIDAAEEEGLITQEEADAYRLDALDEFQLRLMEAEGYNPEDLEYSSKNDLATFSVGNDFGAAVLGLIDEEYESPEDALQVIAENSGLSVDQVVGLIEGEYVPTDELVHAIAECFDSTQDENVYNGLMLVGQNTRAEEGYEDDDYEEEENEDYEDENELEEEEEEEEDDVPGDASYSAYDNRVEELENQIAEFQVSNAVKDNLAQIELKAQELVNQGCLPPIAARTLLGSFDLESDRLAAFSAVCEKNAVDIDTELYAMSKCLEVFERCGPIAQFGQLIQEEIQPPTNEDLEIEELAKRNLQARNREKYGWS